MTSGIRSEIRFLFAAALRAGLMTLWNQTRCGHPHPRHDPQRNARVIGTDGRSWCDQPSIFSKRKLSALRVLHVVAQIGDWRNEHNFPQRILLF